MALANTAHTMEMVLINAFKEVEAEIGADDCVMNGQ